MNWADLLPDIDEVVRHPRPGKRLFYFAFGLVLFTLGFLGLFSVIDGLIDFIVWRPWDWLSWKAVRTAIAAGAWLALCFACSDEVD